MYNIVSQQQENFRFLRRIFTYFRYPGTWMKALFMKNLNIYLLYWFRGVPVYQYLALGGLTLFNTIITFAGKWGWGFYISIPHKITFPTCFICGFSLPESHARAAFIWSITCQAMKNHWPRSLAPVVKRLIGLGWYYDCKYYSLISFDLL